MTNWHALRAVEAAASFLPRCNQEHMLALPKQSVVPLLPEPALTESVFSSQAT